MKYRSRLALAFVLCTVVPLLGVGLIVQRETNRRIADQYEENVAALASTIVDAFGQEDARVRAALGDIRRVMAADNRLRAALLRGDLDSAYVINYAGEAMARAGLETLQLQDSSGRILSSGHFRNDFGRVDAGLAPFLTGVPEGRISIASLMTPDEPLVALIRADTMRVASDVFVLSGGTRFDRSFLASLTPVGEMTVDVTGLPEDLLAPDPRSEGASLTGYALPVEYYDGESGESSTAHVRILHDASPLEALVADVSRWFMITVGLAGLAALVVALWLASRMSKPIVELAEMTERIDLDRLDVSFRSTRRDEVGLLARRLGQMTRRLRQSADEIREAERRATLGDVARQVNHDVKNGLTPIRNVVRHLAKLSAADPQSLPRVFAERERTLTESIEYLEELAANYARLSPRASRLRCDVSEIVGQVARDHAAGPARTAGGSPATDGAPAGVRVHTSIAPGAEVAADPISIRRIVENLFRNALQSLDGTGEVTLSVERVDAGSPEGGMIRLGVADTGRGMSAETRSRIFDDFFTTRAAGTGLGLSIVRRLVMDLGGSISVESEEGRGSRFMIDLPPYQQRGGGEVHGDGDGTDS